MTTLLTSKQLIEQNIALLKNKSEELIAQGRPPFLQIILVGDNAASQTYVNNKKNFAQKMGAKFELILLPENCTREEFLNAVEKSNNNPEVTGCLIQLPLPKHLEDIDVYELVAEAKDVDGFSSSNAALLYKNDPSCLAPCTAKGIMTLLDFYDINVAGKNVVIVGRSFIVGRPLALLMTNANATITLCHSKTKDLATHTKNADIIVAAIGRTKFLNASHFRSDKSQIVIDVGINRDELNKLCGDVDFEAVKNNVAAITPVPGGVGPMTIYTLGENLLQATKSTLLKG